MTMIEILKSLEHLPIETLEVIQALSMMGVLGFLVAYFIASFVYGFENMICNKRWRINHFKFLTDDDIEILNDYLEEDRCCYEIGEIISNAYKKDIELKRIRKGWWKKLWKKDKEQ